MTTLIVILGLLVLGLVGVGIALWRSNSSLKETVEESDGTNRKVMGLLTRTQDQNQSLMAELHTHRAIKAQEWAKDGSLNRNVEDLDQSPVKALMAADESLIMAHYGRGSEMHQAFLDRNGAPGEERFPSGINPRVTGTVDQLANGLVNHGPDGGVLEFHHQGGEIKAVESKEGLLTPEDLGKIAEEVYRETYGDTPSDQPWESAMSRIEGLEKDLQKAKDETRWTQRMAGVPPRGCPGPY